MPPTVPPFKRLPRSPRAAPPKPPSLAWFALKAGAITALSVATQIVVRHERPAIRGIPWWLTFLSGVAGVVFARRLVALGLAASRLEPAATYDEQRGLIVRAGVWMYLTTLLVTSMVDVPLGLCLGGGAFALAAVLFFVAWLLRTPMVASSEGRTLRRVRQLVAEGRFPRADELLSTIEGIEQLPLPVRFDSLVAQGRSAYVNGSFEAALALADKAIEAALGLAKQSGDPSATDGSATPQEGSREETGPATANAYMPPSDEVSAEAMLRCLYLRVECLLGLHRPAEAETAFGDARFSHAAHDAAQWTLRLRIRAQAGRPLASAEELRELDQAVFVGGARNAALLLLASEAHGQHGHEDQAEGLRWRAADTIQEHPWLRRTAPDLAPQFAACLESCGVRLPVAA